MPSAQLRSEHVTSGHVGSCQWTKACPARKPQGNLRGHQRQGWLCPVPGQRLQFTGEGPNDTPQTLSPQSRSTPPLCSPQEGLDVFRADCVVRGMKWPDGGSAGGGRAQPL